ncbi:membrane protein insertion efficiency factor YidD [Teredinibacter turnerae]|uniref:membrane protein insertion efficiency factor YidD n=2 Tax=Teredinibacter turnerae TaxID=2426 RepID=UPI0009B67785
MGTCCQKGQQSEPAAAQRIPFAAKIMLAPVYFYRYFISPLIGPRCRFEPTCSQYAIDAVATWGIARGSALATRRLLKCHPWHSGGYDPVPESGHPTKKQS